MSIGELGALGEFLGFFAVLATLVYLAVQTRQTRKLATIQTARNVVADYQLLWSTLGEDPERTRLIRLAVNDWNGLHANDQMIAHSFFSDLVIHLASALEQQDQLPELEDFIRGWEDNVLGFLQCEGGRTWWDTCESFFLDVVRDRIAERLANPDELPPSWTDVMPWWKVDEAERRGAPGVASRT